MAFDFNQLQQEHAEWVQKQPWYGQPSHACGSQALHGMSEELEEFVTSMERPSAACDALVDLLIFAVDYCNRVDWCMQEIFEDRAARFSYGSLKTNLTIAVGRLHRAHLKHLQGIRGTQALHRALGRQAMGAVCYFAASYWNDDTDQMFADLEDIWNKVKQRDFTARPATG